MFFGKVFRVCAVSLSTVLAVGCERKMNEPQDPELVELCTAGARAEVCFADPPPDYDVQEHIDYCVDVRQPEADAISEECGKLHKDLMGCLDGRDCVSELPDWFFNRLADGNYVCSAETAAFREACPGVWFAPE